MGQCTETPEKPMSNFEKAIDAVATAQHKPFKMSPKQDLSDETTRECRRLMDQTLAQAEAEINDYKSRITPQPGDDQNKQFNKAGERIDRVNCQHCNALNDIASRSATIFCDNCGQKMI